MWYFGRSSKSYYFRALPLSCLHPVPKCLWTIESLRCVLSFLELMSLTVVSISVSLDDRVRQRWVSVSICTSETDTDGNVCAIIPHVPHPHTNTQTVHTPTGAYKHTAHKHKRYDVTLALGKHYHTLYLNGSDSNAKMTIITCMPAVIQKWTWFIHSLICLYFHSFKDSKVTANLLDAMIPILGD